MSFLKEIEYNGKSFLVFCPGCGMSHIIRVEPGKIKGPVWKWDGSFDKPTFSPSIKVTGGPEGNRTICHSFIRNGQWIFLNDCTHDLAGKTVSMEEVI